MKKIKILKKLILKKYRLKEKPKIIFCNVSMALINYFEITVKNTGTEW